LKSIYKKFNQIKLFAAKHRATISFVISFSFLIILKMLNTSQVQVFTNFSLDNYQKIFKYSLKESPVVIIDIDEKSLGEVGQFPWNRKVFSNLLDRLSDAQPSIIAFDVFFSEEDKLNPRQIIKAFNIEQDSLLAKEILKLPNSDDIFLNSIKKNNVVMPILGQVTKPVKNIEAKPLVNFIFRGPDFDHKRFLYKFPYMTTSLTIINENAKGIGSISRVGNTEGVLRKVPLLINMQGQTYPALSIESLRLHLSEKNILVETDDNGVKNVKIRPYTIETDANSMIWIKYKKSKSEQYISAYDILNSNFDSSKIKGKILLIGSSAQGLFDFTHISNGKVIPGVEVHANVIENIVNDNYLRRNNFTFLIEMTMLIIGMFLAFYAAGNVSLKYGLTTYTVIATTITLVGIFFYRFENYLIDITYPIFCVNLLYFNRLYFRYLGFNDFLTNKKKK
jgi:CHASE2 domain-containing sensor protein